MSNEKSPLPVTRHKDEIESLKTWASKYGSQALTVGLLVLIALTTIRVVSERSKRHNQEATIRMASARSISDFEAVLNDFGKTKAAPIALLSIAKLNFDNGNYELANAKYDQFIATWPKHALITTAQLGRIFCIEARGDNDALQEASTAFAAFAAEHLGHYLAPQALFGHARCLEQLGQLDDARMIYEDFIASNPENSWSVRAEELLGAVQLRIKRGSKS